MSRSAQLNDREAAYHVPHLQTTDICHLQSPSCLPHTHTHKNTHRSATVLASKASVPLIFLISQTVCCSTPYFATRGMKESRWAKREKDGRAGNSFIGEGSCVLKGAALAGKTLLQPKCDWFFQMAAHSAQVIVLFPSSADSEMRV